MPSRPSDRSRLFAALYWTQAIYEPLGYARHRRALARGVSGATLEVGIGTGFSLKHYATQPAAAVDCSVHMVRRARRRAERLGLKVPMAVADAAALPFRAGAFDTVVTQSVLCSVDEPAVVAREIHRTLRPGGQYRFTEHGQSARVWYARVQRRIAPVWRHLFGGCRLDGDPVGPIEDAGFVPTKLRRCNGGAVARGTFHVAEDRL